jgi:hypothetical protein
VDIRVTRTGDTAVELRATVQAVLCQRLRFPPERSIGPETFARLVRDCWIGTSGKASAALHRFLPGLRAMPPAHLVIAYDERRR